MEVVHRGGDIADVAPEVAEAAALWLRGGFNLRSATWDFRLKDLIGWKAGVSRDKPWMSQDDSLLELQAPRRLLRYIYVFRNPQDALAYSKLDDVRDAVMRCLSCFSDLGIRKVAMIQIPWSRTGSVPTREDNLESANTMVQSVRDWDLQNRHKLDRVVLVDLQDDFAQVLDLRE